MSTPTWGTDTPWVPSGAAWKTQLTEGGARACGRGGCGLVGSRTDSSLGHVPAECGREARGSHLP